MRVLVAAVSSLLVPAPLFAQEIRRDLLLEQQVRERRLIQAQVLQPEAVSKITLAVNATLARLAAGSGDSDALAIAREEVSRQFRRTTTEQADLLTFQVLAEMKGILESEQDTKDRLGDVNAEVLIKMQMLNDQRSNFMEMLSNMMKKVSETSQQVIQNMK